VFPLANLIATGQVGLGDLIVVDYGPTRSKLTFLREDQGVLARSGRQLVAGSRLGSCLQGAGEKAVALPAHSASSRG